MAKASVKLRKYLPRYKKGDHSIGAKLKSGAVDNSVEGRLNPCFSYFTPREQIPTLEWCLKYARNTDGRPYSHNQFPHLGAPGGPADAMDDPNVRKIYLQFASRLGKTYFGQCCQAKKADCDPGPMMFASSVEKTAIEVTERTYKILAATPKVAWQLRPEHRRKQALIDYDACQCHVAWSRSVSTLADKEVEFGHANEIDKWEHTSTSREADPLKLFTDRVKNRPHHKLIIESTPSVKNNSRVEAGRLGSTNCLFFVPCPHCKEYQTLEMGSKEEPRLRWDKLPNGRSDKDLARRTAKYLCKHCTLEVSDEDRPFMMRHGVWCPEGCSVDSKKAMRAAKIRYTSTLPPAALDSPPEKLPWDGWSNAEWIIGTPLRDSGEAGYKLSSLYALSLTWGDIAAEFVSCEGKPQDLRNFINQWLADTWEHVKNREDWEKLGARIISTEFGRDLVPPWASLLTCGVDRQDEDGSRFPWVVTAWGETDIATISYGEMDSFAEILKMFEKHWARVGETNSIQISVSLVDSGYRPDGVYEFCKQCLLKGLKVYPSKGSSTVLESDYRQSILGPNTSMPGMPLFLIDTVRSQLWTDQLLSREQPAEKYHLCAGSLLDHQDFLEQITNDAAVEKLDASNNIRQSWERINLKIPNDFRDCLRYSWAAKQILLGGRPVPRRADEGKPVQATQQTVKRNAVVGIGVTRPDGRPFL